MDLLAALRWCLFVERVWPPNASELADPTIPEGAPPAQIAAIAKASLAIAELRTLVFPGDEP